MYFVIKGDSIMHFILYLGEQLSLYIPKKYLPFFEPLGKGSPYNKINLKLENSSGSIVVDNVLDNKKIDKNCPEITKLGDLVDELRRKKKNKDKIYIIEIRIKLKDNSTVTYNLNTPTIKDNNLIINGITSTINLDDIEEIILKLDM